MAGARKKPGSGGKYRAFDLHLSPTPITYGQVKLEHPSQQYRPGQSMPSLLRCGLPLTAAGVGCVVGRFRTRHDHGAPARHDSAPD